jgi:hypothetical protein
VFDTFDLDKDGVIDETDFGSIVDHLLGGTPPELTKRLYAAFKPDANGKLTKQHFVDSVEEQVTSQAEKSGGKSWLSKKLFGDSKTVDDAKFDGTHSASGDETKSSSFVLDHNSTLHHVIVTSRLIASVYYLVGVPYECAFIHSQQDVSESWTMMVIGWAFDTILYIDLISKFHLTYINKKGARQTDITKIRKHYLAHGFTYDLLSLLPIDLFVYASLRVPVAKLGFFRIVRLLRCIDIVTYFSTR